MNQLWNHRSVLVAGCRGELGECFVDASLMEGAFVAGLSRSGIERQHPRFLSLKADITDSASLSQAFVRLDELQRPPDTLIINAAGLYSGMLALLTDDAVSRGLMTNLGGPMLLIREATRRMMRSRFGRIILISSIAAHRPFTGSAVYGAAKAGLEQLGAIAALEGAMSGITVNSIAVGMLDSGLALELGEKHRAMVKAQTVGNRSVTPEEIWRAVRFFSDEANKSITGQVLKIGFI